ncbi:MAG: leucine-rich repeat domain-containing protein, partial [Gaiellales bacterium]
MHRLRLPLLGSMVLGLGVLALLGAGLAQPPTAVAAAEGGFSYSVSSSKATVTGCSPTPCAESITIPATLGGFPVTAIDAWAFRGPRVSAVTLPVGLLTIGESAFEGTSLVSLSIPSTVTTIEAQAFRDTRYLLSVDFGTSSPNVGAAAFRDASALQTISFGTGAPSIGPS